MRTGRRSNRLAPALLALFVTAGSLKSHPLLAWLPIDLTMLLAAGLLVSCFTAIIDEGFIPHAFWLPVLLVFTTITGLAELAPGYGTEKALHFYTLTLLGMLAATLFLRSESQRSTFLKTLAVVGVVVTLLVTVAPARPAEWSTVVTLPGANTIGTSRMILAGAIAVILHAIIGNRKTVVRVLLVALAGLMILTALNTGSRGPILAAALGVILALLLTPAFGRRRLRSIVLLATLGAFGVTLAGQSGEGGLGRIIGLLDGGTDASAGARSYFWELAWANIPKFPFGGGWGYFGRIVQSSGIEDVSSSYPHNSVLGITLEAGWVAGATFLTFAVIALVRYVRASKDAQTAAFFVLFVFALGNSLVSGDINDNRLMWVMLAASFVISRVNATHSPAETGERAAFART